MKVDTMRHIDYYVGIPLCFIGSLCQKIVKLFTGSEKKAPKNVLFIELSEMGSAILVDPAMRKLQKEAGANLHFAIFKKINQVLICWAQFRRKIFAQFEGTIFFRWHRTV